MEIIEKSELLKKFFLFVKVTDYKINSFSANRNPFLLEQEKGFRIRNGDTLDI